MQKINKTAGNIVALKYKDWLNKLPVSVNDGNYRHYYDDVAMNLYRCQLGVCAYTEMHLCKPELYADGNWVKGKHKVPENAAYDRQGHCGEMDHFDPDDKKLRYWNWDNLFMIDASLNARKTNKPIVAYLKPDLPDYSPEKYFDYDPETNDYYPNTDIKDGNITNEIQYMINEVLYLNHPEVKYQRYNYLNLLKFQKKHGVAIHIDQFFTSVKWALGA